MMVKTSAGGHLISILLMVPSSSPMLELSCEACRSRKVPKYPGFPVDQARAVSKGRFWWLTWRKRWKHGDTQLVLRVTNSCLRRTLAWSGSPTMIDMLNVDGDVALTSGHGRFVQAESAEALKLLGIFDFTSLSRRFRLDFSDVVSDGMSFSGIGGVTRLDDGHVQIVEPIVIDASGSTFMVGGSVDLHSETLDNDMMTLPLSKNLPWYAAYSTIATGPIAGAGSSCSNRSSRINSTRSVVRNSVLRGRSMSQSLSLTLYSIGESGRVKVNRIMRTLMKAKTADLQLIL